MKPPPKVLTVSQASAVLGISERSLRRYLKEEVIMGFQYTYQGHWYVPAAEIQRLCDMHWITPDWSAAGLAVLADSDGDTPEAASLAP